MVLPDAERHDPASLGNLSVALPDRGSLPLLSAVDPGANNSNAVVADLVAGPLPAIVERHGVEWTLKGRQEEQ